MDCAAVEAGSTAIDANKDTRRRRGCAGWSELQSGVIPADGSECHPFTTPRANMVAAFLRRQTTASGARVAAEVGRTNDSLYVVARLTGTPSLGLGLWKQQEARLVGAVQSVKRQLAEAEAALAAHRAKRPA
jgi:hypothetical protein